MAGGIISGLLTFIYLILAKTAFIWAPIILMYFAFELWHHFVTERFILGIEWTLFEVEVPRDVQKTPLAMELILSNAMYQASVKGLWQTWIKGEPHLWFSLEMTGIEGGVHFYIRTPSRIKDLLETQIYAQYPQAKVREVEDYALRIPADEPNKDWYMWGTEFTLEKHIALPIKTYVDYGLDKPSDKEELKIDPITPTIEFLGSLRRGEQVWIQHVIRPSKLAFHSHEKKGHIGWVEEVREEIGRTMAPWKRFMEASPGSPTLVPVVQMPKPVENTVAKMQEKIQKLGFDIGIRMIILGEKKYVTQQQFDNTRRAARLLFRQYSNPDLNGLVRANAPGFLYAWKDPTGKKTQVFQKRFLDWYRLRVFFHPPLWFTDSSFIRAGRPKITVMNTAEIATIFHFPGQVSQAPSFRRVDSKVAKPPANLPV